MAQLFYGGSMYGIGGSIVSADAGVDAILIEPGNWLAYEWGSGLGRIDREGTFSTDPDTALRTGILRRFLLRFGDLAGLNSSGGARKEHLFPTMAAVQQVVYEELNKYKVGRTVSGKYIGSITVVKDAILTKVNKNRAEDAVLSIVAGGVTYTAKNYVDCTPELDLLRMANVTLRLGRESRELSGEGTAGNRRDTPSGVLAYNVTTGQRIKPLRPAPRERIHDGDARPMAFNQRIIVSQDPNRIKWADLGPDLPWYNASNYDVDYQLAKDGGYNRIPGSPAADAMLPIVGMEEHDMNNGGGLPIGSNWPGELFEWHYATHERRRYLHALYTQVKAGLFYDICTNPRWAALPRKVVKDSNGNVISDTQIAEDTATWGLVPGVFDYPGGKWAANTAYAVGVRKYKRPYIYEVTTAGTTGTTGPSGEGTAITDGTVVWKMYLPFVPGMSPHVYVRESFRIASQYDLNYDHTQAPEHNVPEAICAYGYPHMDGHIVQRFANSDGYVTHEGNDELLAPGGDVVALLMPWGACKPFPGECRNVSAVCGVGATRLGWIPSRIEFSYIKIANALAIIGAIADKLGIYSNDVDYDRQARQALIDGEMYVELPKAAA